MNASFGLLGSIELRHPYFADGLLRGGRFALPDDTAALLRAGRLQSRLRDGVWHLLIERVGTQPRVALRDGTTLWIGVRPEGGPLEHVTAPLVSAGHVAFLANATDFGSLDPPLAVRLASGLHALPLDATPRPLTVRLRLRDDTVIAQITVQGDETSVALDLRALPAGLYRAEEDDGSAPPRSTHLLVHPALHAHGVPVVVGLRLSAALYGAASPPVWHVDFVAAAQPLEYYVVARNFGASEFGQLRVRDEGFGDDGRPEIPFDRIEQAALDPALHLTPALMGAEPGARVALFRSRAPVPRRERPRRRLQLTRNNDVLIDHLPQPDASRAKSQFVIHLSKP